MSQSPRGNESLGRTRSGRTPQKASTPGRSQTTKRRRSTAGGRSDSSDRSPSPTVPGFASLAALATSHDLEGLGLACTGANLRQDLGDLEGNLDITRPERYELENSFVSRSGLSRMGNHTARAKSEDHGVRKTQLFNCLGNSKKVKKLPTVKESRMEDTVAQAQSEVIFCRTEDMDMIRFKLPAPLLDYDIQKPLLRYLNDVFAGLPQDIRIKDIKEVKYSETNQSLDFHFQPSGEPNPLPLPLNPIPNVPSRPGKAPGPPVPCMPVRVYFQYRGVQRFLSKELKSEFLHSCPDQVGSPSSLIRAYFSSRGKLAQAERDYNLSNASFEEPKITTLRPKKATPSTRAPTDSEVPGTSGTSDVTAETLFPGLDLTK